MNRRPGDPASAGMSPNSDYHVASKTLGAGKVGGGGAVDGAVLPRRDAVRAETPSELFHQYLGRDARARERMASTIALMLAGVGLMFLIGTTFLAPQQAAAPFYRGGPFMVLVLVFVVAYEDAVLVALRRGWFHPALPFLNNFVEVAVYFAMQLIAAFSVTPERALSTPWNIAFGGMLVFGAVRMDPRVPLFAGVLSAVLMILFYAAVAGRIAPTPDQLYGWPIAIHQSLLALFCGLAGAALARYMVGRAEDALREMREQDLFGKYVLHERVGQGGMGEVFRATYCPEGGFRRVVAVKRVRPERAADVRFVDAFRQEAMLGASLVHPNLVQMLDFGRFQGTYVVAMEFVDGATLDKLLKSGEPLPVAAVTYVAAELLNALGYIHSRRGPDGALLGLVHCDVNPPNVFVSTIGEVKLGDYGVARAEGSTGDFAGKVAYAAPEQLQCLALDGRADLYGLGVTLFEALTLERFSDKRRDHPPVASSLRREVPPLLDQLVGALLAPDRETRPTGAEEARALLLSLPPQAQPYPHGCRLLAEAVARLQ